nr:hypothetical protein [uncultured Sellimonas sp.]
MEKKEEYWRRFQQTGKIEDYLTYKGITDRKDEKGESEYHCDGHDPVGGTHGGIR